MDSNGPKITILNNLTNSVGQHIQYLPKDLFMINAFGDNDWVMNWRVFYYAWFVAWVPFVGMFVARISKGRTIREFIMGVVFVPTIFTILWLSVFSAIALSTVQGWSIENVQQLIASPETAVFIIFENYPFSKDINDDSHSFGRFLYHLRRFCYLLIKCNDLKWRH